MKTSRLRRNGSRSSFFPLTVWPEILKAKTTDPERRKRWLDAVLGRYWRPLYLFLRAKGYAHEDCEDCIQGFVKSAVLQGSLIASAAPEKGRFRTWLVRSLNHYLVSEWRKNAARKRRPPGGLVSLDEAQSLANQLATTGEDPERAFDLELIRVLLAEVIEIVRRECQAANQTVHWEIFCLTMLSPIFDGSVAPPLSRLCQELRIPDTSQASNMNGTVKRRFQRVLRARIRQFVHSDDEIDEGIRTLFEILAAARQAGDADCVCTDDAARQRVEILTGTTGIDREPRDGEAE